MTAQNLRHKPAAEALDPLRSAAVLAARFAETAAAYDESAAFPSENIRLLHEAGLVALTAPAEFGGGGAGFAEAVDRKSVV